MSRNLEWEITDLQAENSRLESQLQTCKDELARAMEVIRVLQDKGWRP